jgi:transcriptional regulator with XRE-family HTH domain
LKRSSSQRGHNILGKRIRLARVRAKSVISQSDLAARLTVLGIRMDRASVTRIENGKRYLRDFEIRAIAKVLKVSATWLFRETD